MADRIQALFAQLVRGLLHHGDLESKKLLGDRRHYVGMSDVGKGVECMRSAVAGKLGLKVPIKGQAIESWYTHGKHDQIYNTLCKQLILQRGHWLEAGVLPALEANGSKVFPQLEVSTEYKGVPIKVHIDFTLAWDTPKPSVRILELKSTKRVPDALYTAYETQLYGQLGFLVDCWNQPVFAMRDHSGVLRFENMTFPEAVQYEFGFILPDDPLLVDIEGWVLCLAMDAAKGFGPYKASSVMLNVCKKTAETIWFGMDAVRSEKMDLNDIAYCKGFHPLCDYCDHADTCPKFEAEFVDDPDSDDLLAELLALKDKKKMIAENIAAKEEQIKRYFKHQGYPTGSLKTRYYRVMKTHYKGASRTDLQKLTKLLKNEICEVRVEKLLNAAAVQGKPYDRLSIVKLKGE